MRRVRIGGANSVSDKDLNLELSGTVFVDTSDYDDRTVPHTIRVLSRIGSSGNMTVKGCGKLVFEHYSDFWGALTVQDTATVAVNPGCGFSRGGKFAGANVTLAEGAPKWAKRVRVDNNEIVLDVITLGTYIFVK